VKRRQFSGKPVPVVETVVADFRSAKIAIGPGVVVRVEGTSKRSQMLRMDRNGVSRVEMSGELGYTTPRFSPDGRRIAFVTDFLGGGLWVMDRARGSRQRLALGKQALGPEWSRDGRRLTFGYILDTSWDIYAASADGSGTLERLVGSTDTEFPVGWGINGELVFWRTTLNRGDIFYRDAAGTEHEFAVSKADERSPVLSPDGRWIVYVSDESGRREVYVRPFPAGEGRWQVSSEGGIEPRWSKYGREIVYRDRGWFLGVQVIPETEFRVGVVDSLFQGPYIISGVRAQYDVSADGSELLVVGVPPESRTINITLTQPGPR
jgi:dipeptidyl aminopeptidase/acylaminoacyl peptidase